MPHSRSVSHRSAVARPSRADPLVAARWQESSASCPCGSKLSCSFETCRRARAARCAAWLRSWRLPAPVHNSWTALRRIHPPWLPQCDPRSARIAVVHRSQRHSRDLAQAEFGGVTAPTASGSPGVAIADGVPTRSSPNTPMDSHPRRDTSGYTASEFPSCPEASLDGRHVAAQGADKLNGSPRFVVGADGASPARRVSAVIRNMRAHCTTRCGAWLRAGTLRPPRSRPRRNVQDKLQLQSKIAQSRHPRRFRTAR